MATTTREELISFLGPNYTKSDDQLIDIYIENLQIYNRMREELKSQNLMLEHTNKANATNLTKNPLLIEIPKYTTTLNNLLKSMGLTPAQRKQFGSFAESGDLNDDFDSF